MGFGSGLAGVGGAAAKLPPPPAPTVGAGLQRAAAPFVPPPSVGRGLAGAAASVQRAAPVARPAPAPPSAGRGLAGVAPQVSPAAQAAQQAQHTSQLAALARVIATSMRSGQAAYNLPPTAARMAQTASQLGFNRAATAGLIGNATQESGLNASLNEGTGKGLFSWDPTNNPSEAAKVQLGNVDQQIRQVAATLGPQGIQAMNRAGGPEAAATWFEQNFERADPAQANMVRRTTAARQAYGA